MAKHNDYIFSNDGGRFRFLRRFDEMYQNCEDPHGQSKELQRTDYHLVATMLSRVMCSLQDSAKPARILDVGCGLGFFTSHIKKLFSAADVSGCDISETAVAKAMARVPQCKFFTADIKDGASLPRCTYDVLVALDVLYYFTDEEITNVLHNLHRLLENGGFLLVGYHLPKEMNFGRYIQSLEDARVLLESKGFSFRLTLDVINDLDKTYVGDPVGRHIYFLAQRSPPRLGGVHPWQTS